MREEVRFFTKAAAEVIDFPDPIVEIGSYQVAGQEGFADLRPFFAKKNYIGCDLRPGRGVDRIEDVQNLSFPDESVGSVLCCDTMEHVADIIRAVKEMLRILNPEGIALFTSVMNYPIHEYPHDFWRFTPQVFMFLLRGLAHYEIFYQGKPEFPEGIFAVGTKTVNHLPALKTFKELLKETTSGWNDPMVCLSGSEKIHSFGDYHEEPGTDLPSAGPALQYDSRLEEHPIFQKVINYIKPRSSILEIGCATGYMSTFFIEKLKCRVVGVEIDTQAAGVAEKRGVEVINGDIEGEGVFASISALNRKFDYVLFLDVFEHLIDPLRILRRVKDFLKKEGMVFASFPNVAYLGLVGELVEGKFEYRHQGILDAGHLKFFTRDSLKSFFKQGGYLIDSTERIIPDLKHTEFKLLSPEMKEFILRHNREGEVYQYLIGVRAATYPNLLKSFYNLESQFSRLNATIEQNRGEIADLNQVIAEKEEGLQELNRVLHERERHVQDLNRALHERERHVQDLNWVLHERERHVQDLNQVIAEKEGGLQELNRVLHERERHVQELNSSLDFKNRESGELQKIIEKQNADITALREYLGSLTSSRGWRWLERCRKIKYFFIPNR